MDKEQLYKDVISILNYVELVVNDKKQFAIIRKQLLDLANNIMRLGETDA